MNSLIVGSGPSAPSLESRELTSITKVAINNAWLVRSDFDYVVYPFDFPSERRPPSNYCGRQISNAGYMEAINTAGGIIFGGATMAFAAGYWAVYTLRSKTIGVFASDMVYRGTKTHFYGNGTADPLRSDVSLQHLEAKSARLFLWALTNGVLLVNCSEEPESRLVYPRLSLSDLSNHEGVVGQNYGDLIERANEVFELERNAPFDAKREDYWTLADTPDKMNYIHFIDKQWAATIPLIQTAFSDLAPDCSLLTKVRRLFNRCLGNPS
ncbi:hypothetical protein [Agrobacterium tumefaciens]|uniref:hypothetical protein n=1 Tax=Agrobacterium tumefaciens TaxID=358 RepID=UPI0021CF6ABB|nr:hypothetical protein [Agrobacterium tumefaciens]UXS03433.1 hypothetical protein FY156_17890 [Agrobacterium tumefaciens]